MARSITSWIQPTAFGIVWWRLQIQQNRRETSLPELQPSTPRDSVYPALTYVKFYKFQVMKVSHSNHFEKFGLPPRTRSWPMSISSLHIEDEQVTGWLHPATSLPSIGLELSGFLVSPIITLISCFFWFMPIQNLRNRILKHQALANGVHPDVDFEGNQLPYWMAQMANKPIAGGEDQTLIFLCSSRTISYDFVSPQSVRQESFPVHTLPSCTYTTSPFLRWPCSAGGVEGRLEVYPRSLLSPLPLRGKRDMSSVCCQKNHWSKQKRQESWIDVYISFCFFGKQIFQVEN